jgi:hypothetical protein
MQKTTAWRFSLECRRVGDADKSAIAGGIMDVAGLRIRATSGLLPQQIAAAQHAASYRLKRAF